MHTDPTEHARALLRSCQALAFQALLRGDINRARELATDFARIRDDLPTDAENTAKYDAWREMLSDA